MRKRSLLAALLGACCGLAALPVQAVLPTARVGDLDGDGQADQVLMVGGDAELRASSDGRLLQRLALDPGVLALLGRSGGLLQILRQDPTGVAVLEQRRLPEGTEASRQIFPAGLEAWRLEALGPQTAVWLRDAEGRLQVQQLDGQGQRLDRRLFPAGFIADEVLASPLPDGALQALAVGRDARQNSLLVSRSTQADRVWQQRLSPHEQALALLRQEQSLWLLLQDLRSDRWFLQQHQLLDGARLQRLGLPATAALTDAVVIADQLVLLVQEAGRPALLRRQADGSLLRQALARGDQGLGLSVSTSGELQVLTLDASDRPRVEGYDGDGQRLRQLRFPALSAPQIETAELPVAADATLYGSADGSLANGAGEHLFVGAAGTGDARRALLAVDLTALPGGATLLSGELRLSLSRSRANLPQPLLLHRALASWNEGPSRPGGEEGAGTASQAGDVTWRHRRFPDLLWRAAGGDFGRRAHLRAEVGFGPNTLALGPATVADLRAWQQQPGLNHGWLLRADEGRADQAMRFDSRSNPLPETRPALRLRWLQPVF
ncbi:MAG TPA: hypothetical protein VFV27_07795 [Nevskiaceae bacterium]|nr:hypothetical protein [Nevskiaceae bacterium]